MSKLGAMPKSSHLLPEFLLFLLLLVHCIFLLFHFFSHPSLSNLKGRTEPYRVWLTRPCTSDNTHSKTVSK